MKEQKIIAVIGDANLQQELSKNISWQRNLAGVLLILDFD
jgi:hypothetical protein